MQHKTIHFYLFIINIGFIILYRQFINNSFKILYFISYSGVSVKMKPLLLYIMNEKPYIRNCLVRFKKFKLYYSQNNSTKNKILGVFLFACAIAKRQICFNLFFISIRRKQKYFYRISKIFLNKLVNFIVYLIFS